MMNEFRGICNNAPVHLPTYSQRGHNWAFQHLKTHMHVFFHLMTMDCSKYALLYSWRQECILAKCVEMYNTQAQKVVLIFMFSSVAHAQVCNVERITVCGINREGWISCWVLRPFQVPQNSNHLELVNRDPRWCLLWVTLLHPPLQNSVGVKTKIQSNSHGYSRSLESHPS